MLSLNALEDYLHRYQRSFPFRLKLLFALLAKHFSHRVKMLSNVSDKTHRFARHSGIDFIFYLIFGSHAVKYGRMTGGLVFLFHSLFPPISGLVPILVAFRIKWSSAVVSTSMLVGYGSIVFYVLIKNHT